MTALGFRGHRVLHANMPASPDLRPLSSFYPSKPAMLYDELNDVLFEWTPDRITADYNADGVIKNITWEQAWERCSTMHDAQRGVIEWDGLLIAGWSPAE